MTTMTVLSILATVFGLGEGLFNIPQVYRIFKRKSAKDLSVFTFSFQLISAIIWLLYGLEIRDKPIIISNSFATVTIILILVGWFAYGRELKKKRPFIVT